MGHVAQPALQPSRSTSFAARVLAEVIVALMGAVLLACVVVANQGWLDRHFVPSFFLPRHTYVLLERCGRVFMAILGTWLVFVARPRVGRFASQMPRRTLEILIS